MNIVRESAHTIGKNMSGGLWSLAEIMREKGVCDMNSLKNGLHFLTAVLLLLLIGFMVWYVLFYMPGAELTVDGTLVWNAPGKWVCL